MRSEGARDDVQPDLVGESVELFISHAWEDKPELVRPLADYLQRVGVKVWYDEFSLRPGDSLSRSIDKGTAVARYGLVVVSPHFIAKRWPEYELRGLTAREMASSEKVVIPMWHNVTRDDVLQYSPALADKVAVRTEGKSLEEISEAVLTAIRPDLAHRVSMLRKLIRASWSPDGKTEEVPLSFINTVPPPRAFSTEGYIFIRAFNVVQAIGDVAPETVGDLTTFLLDLHRDRHPEIELRVWELIAAVYSVIGANIEMPPGVKKALVQLLIACSLGNEVIMKRVLTKLPDIVASNAIEKWTQLSKMAARAHPIYSVGPGSSRLGWPRHLREQLTTALICHHAYRSRLGFHSGHCAAPARQPYPVPLLVTGSLPGRSGAGGARG